MVERISPMSVSLCYVNVFVCESVNLSEHGSEISVLILCSLPSMQPEVVPDQHQSSD